MDIQITIEEQFIANVVSFNTNQRWNSGVCSTYAEAQEAGIDAATSMIRLGADKVEVTIDKRTLVRKTTEWD